MRPSIVAVVNRLKPPPVMVRVWELPGLLATLPAIPATFTDEPFARIGAGHAAIARPES